MIFRFNDVGECNAMNHWFTVEKIDSTTYVISEYGHPQKVHSFILIGDFSACLIDTGLGIWNIKDITDAITDKPIQVITTHAHFDHIGNHGAYKEILIHKEEADWLRKGLPMGLSEIRSYILEEPITKPFPENFHIDSYFPFQGESIIELEDDTVIDLGNRRLRIMHTPGHSPGHICILDETNRYLFTGDLIYKGTLYAFLPESDPSVFRRSVQKISELEHIDRIFPSHNDLDVNFSFIQEVMSAFNHLEYRNLLRKGLGMQQYKNVSILL